MAQAELPRTIPAGRWDPRRGVVVLQGNPEWEPVRAAYDRQALEPRPVVHRHRRPIDGYHRWRRRLSWALDVFFGRRP